MQYETLAATRVAAMLEKIDGTDHRSAVIDPVHFHRIVVYAAKHAVGVIYFNPHRKTLSLIHIYGLSYNIEAGYTPYTDCGGVAIYFS